MMIFRGAAAAGSHVLLGQACNAAKQPSKREALLIQSEVASSQTETNAIESHRNNNIATNNKQSSHSIMSNVHGLFSKKKKDDDNDSSDDEDEQQDESNNRFVGGIGDRGGGRCVYCCCVVTVLYIFTISCFAARLYEIALLLLRGVLFVYARPPPVRPTDLCLLACFSCGGRDCCADEERLSHEPFSLSRFDSFPSRLLCLSLSLSNSGLAVLPNTAENEGAGGAARGGAGGNNPDSIFQLASNATSDDQAKVKRTITMVRYYKEIGPIM